MAKELTDIHKAAAEVRDETAMQQNTATRVGGVLTDLAQFVGEAGGSLAFRYLEYGIYVDLGVGNGYRRDREHTCSSSFAAFSDMK